MCLGSTQHSHLHALIQHPATLFRQCGNQPHCTQAVPTHVFTVPQTLLLLPLLVLLLCLPLLLPLLLLPLLPLLHLLLQAQEQAG